MTMTRKDFQRIADELRAVRPYSMVGTYSAAEAMATHQREMWVRTVRAVGTACYAANGRFDRGRFDTACGMDLTS